MSARWPHDTQKDARHRTGQARQEKQFFFEKKNQKTFFYLAWNLIPLPVPEFDLY